MARYRNIFRTILLSALVISTGIANEAATSPPAYPVTDLPVCCVINNSGQVTGSFGTTGDVTPFHAFLYDGTMHDLGTLGPPYIDSEGLDINDSGQVAGTAYSTDRHELLAFIWTPTTPNGVRGTMHDLGTLGGTESFGGSINASGQVAGFSYTTGDAADHAFLWTPTTPNGTSGTMQDLGTLGGLNSYSYNVGTGGQVVGASEIVTTSDRTHAFLYTNGSGMVDLNTLIDPLSGWELSDAADINDAGQITGQGLIGGEYHAYLLTPNALPGDFNGDGTVDAADYVAWRKGLGTTYTQDDFNTWRANFGATLGSGSSQFAAIPLSSAIPEPTSVVLFLSLAAIGVWRHHRGFHRPQFTAAKRAVNLRTFSGPQRAMFVTKVEPSFRTKFQDQCHSHPYALSGSADRGLEMRDRSKSRGRENVTSMTGV